MRPGVAAVSALLTIAGLGLLAGGCGDREESASSKPLDEETIQRARFIKNANAVCQQQRELMSARAQSVYREASGKSRDVGAQQLVNQVVAPAFEREVREIRELPPPPGEEEELEEVLVAIEAMVDRTRADLAKDRGYPYRKTEQLSAAFGLPDCGTP